MNKYIYIITQLLNAKAREPRLLNLDSKISELFDKGLDEIDWILSLSELELIYGFEVPDELYDKTNLTLEEFVDHLAQLPLIPHELYPEFYEIKTTSMKLTKRAIELEVKTDEESIRELLEIDAEFEELTIRLNIILENNNYTATLVN